MPRNITKRLSAAQVSKEREPGRYSDGDGLSLLVSKTGHRFWTWRGTVHGKRIDVGWGPAHLAGLAEMREKARQWRRMCLDGLDPRRARQGALNRAEPPVAERTDGIRVSQLLAEEMALRKAELAIKDASQMRVWRAVRERAAKLFVAAIGSDPFIDEITRDHALTFRDKLIERVIAGEIRMESANKELLTINAMLTYVLKAKRLNNVKPFSELQSKPPKRKTKRLPIPDEWIRDLILNEPKLAGMNGESRDILLALPNTGARPSEIVGLLPHHIHLDVPIPFIEIAEEERQVKNEASLRDIPLVGVALDAMRRHPNGFPRYRGKAPSWSGAANKFLRAAGLPKPFTVYGIRHAFEDRITRAGFSERVSRDLMGHALDRERYGEGLSLAERRDALLRIAY